MMIEVKKVYSTGPFLYKEYTKQKTVLNKEKLDNIGTMASQIPHTTNLRGTSVDITAWTAYLLLYKLGFK
jgi:hypothetical protein